MMTNPRLILNESSTVGAYFSNVNGNDGFICDKRHDINQHTADLLCQSLGLSKAETGNGTGWFNKSRSQIFPILYLNSKIINRFIKFLMLIRLISFQFK